MFSLLHLNCRSIFNKVNLISCFIETLTIPFSVIGFTETWLNDITAPLVNFDDYSFVFKNRDNKMGGGVALMIHKKHQFISHINYFDNAPDFLDYLVVEVINDKQMTVFVVVLYRPPNTDVKEFINHFSNLLKKLPTNKPVYIMGDFNIDLLKKDVLNINTDFSNIMYSYNYYPLITTPTRITQFTSTLIDNIFCNSLMDHISSVINTDISDHFPIFTSFKLFSTTSVTNSNSHHKHNFSSTNLIKLKDHLDQYNWETVMTTNDVDVGFQTFNDIIQDALNKCCPITKRKKCKFKKPWITPGLYNSLKTKNILYKKFNKNPTSLNKKIYTNYKNKFTSLVKMSEKKYYQIKFEEFNNDPKSTWNLIKTILNKNIISPNIILKSDNQIITDKSIVCNKFNSYFNSIFNNNLDSNSKNEYKSYLGPNVPHSFFLIETDPNEILYLVQNFKYSKSSGTDNISNNLLKKIITSIIIPLIHLINLSLKLGKFPEIYKTSKILPVFKSGCKHTLNS